MSGYNKDASPSAVQYVNATAVPEVTAIPVIDVEDVYPETTHTRYGSRVDMRDPTSYIRGSSGLSAVISVIEGRRAQINESDAYYNRPRAEPASDSLHGSGNLLPEGSISFKMPDVLWPVLLSGLVNLGIAVVLLYYFFIIVIFDEEGNVKPFKTSCFDYRDMVDNICLFSAGQVSFGLISVGQLNIGLICIGQANLGILFAFGQVAASLVFAPLGQLCTGWYIHICQLGFGMYQIKYAQCGIQFLKCFCPTAGDPPPAVVVTCEN